MMKVAWAMFAAAAVAGAWGGYEAAFGERSPYGEVVLSVARPTGEVRAGDTATFTAVLENRTGRPARVVGAETG